jgi:hypothetical protein
MSGRTIFEGASPKTQSIDAVKALLAWKGRASDPLPQFVEIGSGEGRVVMVLSNKKDSYYTVTMRTCSCPSATYHPNQLCKHQRKHFPELAKPAAHEAGSIRPTGSFKPFSLLPSEERAEKGNASLTPSWKESTVAKMLIDCHDTLPGEVAYWERKEAVEMLKSEA